MRKLIFIIFLNFIFILVCLNSSWSDSNTSRVWVFFKDKGIVNQDEPMPKLPFKTLLRRQRAGFYSKDISDLPVFPPYIDGVLQFGGKLGVTSRWLNGISIEIPEKNISRIKQLPYVKSIEPVASYKQIAPVHRKPKILPAPKIDGVWMDKSEYYGVSAKQTQQIHIDSLHDKGYYGEGIVIALLDTGFNRSHKALKDIKVIGEYDFVNDDHVTSDEPPDDDIGQDNHGTEVLSIIAGFYPGEFVGVAYKAEYLLAKTERVSYKGVNFEKEIEEDWWVAGLEWAEANGADIVSSSLGYSDWYSYSDMDGKTAKTTIAANMAIERGVMVVVSMGNEGKSRYWPYMSAPADGFNIIAVGAVDETGILANFSSMGPTFDGRIKPDVVAMGDGTYVVDPNGTHGYIMVDGTSMAAPLVAGASALLMQALPGISGSKELGKLLKYTASRATNPDNRYGWGIINTDEAFRLGKDPELMRIIRNWDPTSTIREFQHTAVYPNPIRRDSSTIGLSVYNPKPMISMRIYNILGQLIYQRQDMGKARFFIWNLENESGQKVVPGIYICVVEGDDGKLIKKKVAVID